MKNEGLGQETRNRDKSHPIIVGLPRAGEYTPHDVWLAIVNVRSETGIIIDRTAPFNFQLGSENFDCVQHFGEL